MFMNDLLSLEFVMNLNVLNWLAFIDEEVSAHLVERREWHCKHLVCEVASTLWNVGAVPLVERLVAIGYGDCYAKNLVYNLVLQ